ncbi:unnamed protein product [Mycena citricolor]|uniref:beta-N-acetylhexosaminidase n=1 Tax=Mycena citricolor TaxID=2018698 RepID=A0AAD2JZ99_9AGAR|nr:unnamed protein product [Mycena citricolor]
MLLSLSTALAALVGCATGTLVGIPTVPFTPTSNASLPLANISRILVDSRFASTVDSTGTTLIPPTLLEFAHTFSADLDVLGVTLPVSTATAAAPGSIFLTVSSNTTFLDAAGRHTAEGYSLTVGAHNAVIAGASPLGVFWGTRTLIQQAKLNDLALPIGSGTDAPGWGTRGVMLDAGRHFYPVSFLTELCAYLSFFKQNTLHLHISDNLFNNVGVYTRARSLSLYAAFRLNSNDSAVAGLVPTYHFNESYTREDFDELQSSCAARGVTVIPEIEAPGHALPIVQWKPQLGLSDLSLLNIQHPETIPTMQTIWTTFLPWFQSKVVHIGADEYDSTLADDYIRFVNTMSTFIAQTSNKTIRIWGTNEPSSTSSVSKNITIQHWEFFEDNPFTLLKQGYNVLNSDDGFYIVGKWSGSYPQILNMNRIFAGNPAGGPWAPFVFDTNNATNNPPRSHPGIVGHIAAQWNDYGMNATTVHEAYYSWRDGLPALADKQWGGVLTQPQYNQIFESLHSVVPGQNLDRAIPSKTELIVQYKFQGNTRDSSGNGYDATCHGCKVKSGSVTFPSSTSQLTTPLGSKGRNYTLSFSINPSSKAAVGSTILSGPDSKLLLGNGTVNRIMLVSNDQPYVLNYTLPRGVWTNVVLSARGDSTFLRAGTGPEMQFLTVMGINGQSFVWEPIGIEAPLAQLGGNGFVGSIANFSLTG